MGGGCRLKIEKFQRGDEIATAESLCNIQVRTVKDVSKNSDFARMQGAEKVSPRRICFICKQEIFYATPQLGGNLNFFRRPVVSLGLRSTACTPSFNLPAQGRHHTLTPLHFAYWHPTIRLTRVEIAYPYPCKNVTSPPTCPKEERHEHRNT